MKMLLMFSLMMPVQSFAQVGSRGGGDVDSQAFSDSGWITYYQLLRSYPKDAPKVDLTKLKTALETVKLIRSAKELDLDGEPKISINNPADKSVTVYFDGLKAHPTRFQKRHVLHEYLRFAEVDDKNYQVSNPLVIGLEGSALNQLEDALKALDNALASIDYKNAKRICFDLASVEQAMTTSRQLMGEVRNSKEADLLKLDNSFALHRIDLRGTAFQQYCKGDVYGQDNMEIFGFAVKSTPKNLKCHAYLTRRDALWGLRSIAEANGQKFEKSWSQEWDEDDKARDEVCK